MIGKRNNCPTERTKLENIRFKSKHNYTTINQQNESLQNGHAFSANRNTNRDNNCAPESSNESDDTKDTLDKNETEKIGNRTFFNTLTGRKTTVLILCSLSMFTTACAYSLLAPFYPMVASKKGLSLTSIGMVFSVFELLIFLTSPLIGKYMTSIGVKFTLLSGLFVSGSCNILFGFLDKDPNETTFAVMSVVCRSVEALGMACFLNATMTIAASEFQEHIGTATAVTQAFNSAGFTLGPAVGGLLYSLGGFGLPFYAVGCCILLGGLLLYALVQEPARTIQDKQENSVTGLLRSPMVTMPCFGVALGSAGITMFDALFVTHIESFNLSATAIGGLYMICSLTYMISVPICGYISDKREYLELPIMIFGHFIFGFSFMLNGPSPFLPFVPFNMHMIILSYAFIGVGLGMLMILGLKSMISGAYRAGYGKNVDTYALVNGLFNCGYSCGGFSAPLVGGAVVQRFGFPNGFTAFALLHIVWAVILVVLKLSSRLFGGRREGIDCDKGIPDSGMEMGDVRGDVVN